MSRIDDSAPSVGEILSDPALSREYAELIRLTEQTGKLITKASLRWKKRHFKNAGIALWAWKARQDAREAGLPTPEWVEQYLDHAGASLLALDPKMPAKDRPCAVEKSLLLGGQVGKASGLRAFKRHERDLDITLAILDRVELKQSLSVAAAEVAKKFDLSPPTVKKIYRKHRDELRTPISKL
jgi:hypothetical protein